MQNFIETEPNFKIKWFCNKHYMYLDSSEYMIDNIIKEYQLPVKFRKCELIHKMFPQFIICSISVKPEYEKVIYHVFNDLHEQLKNKYGKEYLSTIITLNQVITKAITYLENGNLDDLDPNGMDNVAKFNELPEDILEQIYNEEIIVKESEEVM